MSSLEQTGRCKSVKMEDLYEAAGLSRQAFHQWKQPSQRQLERTPARVVLQLAYHVRSKYLPGSSAREVYYFIRKRPELSEQLVGWGKHLFEKYCLAKGLRVIPMRFKPKTTIRGDYCFDNLIQGKIITDINQVWVSDISYIFGEAGNLLGYATSLLDIYSRHLIGLSFSRTMQAIDTVHPVLQQAFKTRKIHKRKKMPMLIFHSDGGKQYIEKDFIAKLRGADIQSSMADCCYENAFAEAFNDTLKNHMLSDRVLNSFSELKKLESFIKKCYNQYKPHTGIKRATPLEFEKQIQHLKICQRTPLVLKVIERPDNYKALIKEKKVGK